MSLHGPGPSFSGAPSWAIDHRDRVRERLVCLFLLQQQPMCADEVKAWLNANMAAYWVDKDQNQIGARFNGLRRDHLIGAMMKGGGLWFDTIRSTRARPVPKMELHATRAGGDGTVHIITQDGVDRLIWEGILPPGSTPPWVRTFSLIRNGDGTVLRRTRWR